MKYLFCALLGAITAAGAWWIKSVPSPPSEPAKVSKFDVRQGMCSWIDVRDLDVRAGSYPAWATFKAYDAEVTVYGAFSVTERKTTK